MTGRLGPGARRDGAASSVGWLRRLARDRRGAIAVMGALVILMTAGMSAFTLDLARIQIAKGRLQSAADAALLAAARDINVGDVDLTALARGVFDANLRGAPSGLKVEAFQLVETESALGQAGVALRAEVRLPLFMAGLTGAMRLTEKTSLDLAIASGAVKESMGLELVMVLDNTGSMNGSKIRDLRTAATTLTDVLFGDNESVPNLHVGIVNYSAAMNVGRQHWDWVLTAPAPGCGGPGDDDGGPGNPGNDRDVGNSGESPNGLDFGGGARGRSDACRDRVQGQGNGQGDDVYVGYLAVPPFDRPAESLAAIDAVFAPTQWKGCVRVRSIALSETDDPPAVGGLFAPQFWPSSVLSHDPLEVDQFLTSNRNHINLWPPIEGFDRINNNSTLNRLLNQSSVEVDADRPAVDERLNAGNNGYGPNLGCPAPATPLVSSRAAIMNAINGGGGVDRVEAWARGGTFGNLGLTWGWRMLSPRWRGLWRDRTGVANPALPLDYDTPFNVKALVMMTDGQNTWFQTDFSAFGRPDEVLRRNEINASMLRICDRIKAAGIVLYTVTFGGGVNSATRDLYRRCASDPATETRLPGAKYFHAPSGAQLNDAFQSIGGQVTELRLTQ